MKALIAILWTIGIVFILNFFNIDLKKHSEVATYFTFHFFVVFVISVAPVCFEPKRNYSGLQIIFIVIFSIIASPFMFFATSLIPPIFGLFALYFHETYTKLYGDKTAGIFCFIHFYVLYLPTFLFICNYNVLELKNKT